VLSGPLERRTERTLTDPAAVRAEAESIRGRGYATEDGELQDGVRAVAAPVFSAGGEAVAALGVSGVGERLLDALARHVVELADELSAAIASPHA
jgi:IclR family acetate operon transcriptional repressor